MLAYHWHAALELLEASGTSDAELTRRARHASEIAGDRAAALNAFATAAAQYRSALALSSDDDAAGPKCSSSSAAPCS